MCTIYKRVGSLTAVKSHLARNSITEFSSIQEVIKFQNSYSNTRLQVISDSEKIIHQEASTLDIEISELGSLIETTKINTKEELWQEIERLKQRSDALSVGSGNIIHRLVNFLKNKFLKKKIRNNELNLEIRVSESVQELANTMIKKKARREYLVTSFPAAVHENCVATLTDLERKKATVDEINSSIYGALGEQKVVKELEKLSDEYFLINDFSLYFNKPIYNRRENDYIKSIQIDHLLISPAGIFLIETKNWSEQSLHNLSLRSPIQQIKRMNFVLFKILNEEVSKSILNLKRHHWGEKKITTRNLIVMTNRKPTEEFQYVKILTLNELLGYVKYFKPVFSYEETREITGCLLRLIKYL